MAHQGFGKVAQNRGSGGSARRHIFTFFCGFHIKNAHSTLFIEKRRTVPAVSPVFNRQYKKILVGLSKSLGMSKSRSLAKINERRIQLS